MASLLYRRRGEAPVYAWEWRGVKSGQEMPAWMLTAGAASGTRSLSLDIAHDVLSTSFEPAAYNTTGRRWIEAKRGEWFVLADGDIRVMSADAFNSAYVVSR